MTNNQKHIEKYFTPQFIALFDIIGYKDIFLSGKQRINFGYSSATGERELFVNSEELSPFLFSNQVENILDEAKEARDIHKNIKQKVFSDNFLFCTENNWFGLLSLISTLQTIFVGQGIFIRGAFWYGGLRFTNDFVSGEGIVKADELEKRAKYPRIIIDDTYVKKANEFGKNTDSSIDLTTAEECFDYFCSTFDNEGEFGDSELFINYLSIYPQFTTNNRDFYFEIHKTLVDHNKDNIKEYFCDMLIKHGSYILYNLKDIEDNRCEIINKFGENEYKKRIEKYEWLKMYHNDFCKKDNGRYFECAIIE